MSETNNMQKTRHANPHYFSDEFLVAQTGLTADEMKQQIQKLQNTVDQGIDKTKTKALAEQGISLGAGSVIDVIQWANPATWIMSLVEAGLDGYNIYRKLTKTSNAYEYEKSKMNYIFKQLYDAVDQKFPHQRII